MRIPEKLSHAYIVTGGSAASRAAWGLKLAQAYVCEGAAPPCLRCQHCEKVSASIHPDVVRITIPEKKQEILVEQTRALRTDAYIRPNEAARKVYLIDPADAMNQTAQNTLLKLLEDGPPYAAFLLLTAQPGALLTTIRSRCETLSLPPEEEQPDPELWEKARNLAGLMLKGDEMALAAWLARQETAKLKSREVLDLFQLTQQALRPALARDPHRVVPLLEQLRALCRQRPYNVGPGHLLGALSAACGTLPLSQSPYSP